MSFLSEIISSAGETLRVELNALAAETSNKVLNLKVEVKEAMQNRYIHLIPIMSDKSFERLTSEATALVEDIRQLQERLENETKQEVFGLNKELETLKDSLQEASLSIDLVSNLLAIENNLHCALSERSSNNYDKVGECLLEAHNLLTKEAKDLECLDIYQGIVFYIGTLEDQLLTEALKNWRQFLKWNISEIKKKSKSISLTIGGNKEEATRLIKTLHFYDVDKEEIKYFGEYLLKEVLTPIVLSNTTVGEKKKGEEVILSIDTDIKSKRPQFSCVMDNLFTVFNFLETYLSLRITKVVTFLTLVGELICSDFLSLFVEECLSETIPSKREDLPKYEKTVDDIRNFENQLTKLGFLKDNNILQSYYGNLDSLFANKTKERYLAHARELIKKDLHETKQVGVLLTEDGSPDEELGLPELSEKAFQFPSCQISVSAEKLLLFVQNILKEITDIKDNLAVDLFFTTRDIFTHYMDLTPVYHKKLLESIPQQSALLHNNLMYLAHQMMPLDLEYKSRYPQVLAAHVTSYVDFIYLYRSEAVRILNEQVDRQNEQILSIVKNSGLSSLSNQEEIPKSVERGLRQCLRQLSLLQTVWQGVLPINIYRRTMAYLSKNFIEEIILRVISTKDITANTASELLSIFTEITKELPSIFPDKNEVRREVKSWSRFEELMLVLGGSLVEIRERWSDGKGPLAAEFSPEQVRQLVRALFQVSDRRKALLARIV